MCLFGILYRSIVICNSGLIDWRGSPSTYEAKPTNIGKYITTIHDELIKSVNTTTM